MIRRTSDVNDMIRMKIERNNHVFESLTLQYQIFAKEILLRKTGMDICDAKKHMLKNMNVIEQLQIDNYNKDRENLINQTCTNMDEIDNTYLEKMQRLHDELNTLNQKFRQKMIMIAEISEKIPNFGIATNYVMHDDTTYDNLV